jgi:hypothetical protein
VLDIRGRAPTFRGCRFDFSPFANSAIRNLFNQRFGVIAIRIDVPGKLRIKRSIVTVLCRLFLLFELRLNSNIWPQNSFSGATRHAHA